MNRLGRCAHRAAFAAAVLLILLLTAGCHKRQTVSRRSPPPPQPRSRSSSPSTAHRTPPPTPPVEVEPAAAGSSTETGLASWYAPNGRRSSNGEVYDGNSLTAAHRTLPLGTLVRVTNLSTAQSAEVRITDRGPFVRGRILDLSTTAAKATGVYRVGVARVRIEVLELGAGAAAPGRWCVQVGAFSEEANAAELKADLTRRYSTSAHVIEFPGATGHWVRINPNGGSRAQAQSIAQAIRPVEAEVQAYLVRLD